MEGDTILLAIERVKVVTAHGTEKGLLEYKLCCKATEVVQIYSSGSHIHSYLGFLLL